MSRTTRTASLAAALAAVALLPLPAAAKAPENVPTMEEVQQKARLAEAEAQRKAAASQRDPRKDAIEDYKSKKTKLEDYQALVQIVLDAKTPEVQDYRVPAADALVKRFEAEDLKEAKVRQTRIDIALELSDLLKAPAGDDKGLLIAEQVFYAWYRAQVINTHWKKEGKLRDRQAAYNKIRKHLKNSEKD